MRFNWRKDYRPSTLPIPLGNSKDYSQRCLQGPSGWKGNDVSGLTVARTMFVVFS